MVNSVPLRRKYVLQDTQLTYVVETAPEGVAEVVQTARVTVWREVNSLCLEIASSRSLSRPRCSKRDLNAAPRFPNAAPTILRRGPYDQFLRCSGCLLQVRKITESFEGLQQLDSVGILQSKGKRCNDLSAQNLVAKSVSLTHLLHCGPIVVPR